MVASTTSEYSSCCCAATASASECISISCDSISATICGTGAGSASYRESSGLLSNSS
jgi:hypothetical protein